MPRTVTRLHKDEDTERERRIHNSAEKSKLKMSSGSGQLLPEHWARPQSTAGQAGRDSFQPILIDILDGCDETQSGSRDLC